MSEAQDPARRLFLVDAAPNRYVPIEEGGSGGVAYGGHAARKAPPNYRAMSNDQLDRAVQDLELEVEKIQAALDVDSEYGSGDEEERVTWRRRAGKALSYRRAFLALARRAKSERKAEQAKAAASPSAVTTTEADAERTRLRIAAQEAHARVCEAAAAAHREKRLAAEAVRAAGDAQAKALGDARLAAEWVTRPEKAYARAIHHVRTLDRDAERGRLFIRAMGTIIDKETRALVWSRAREMEPDNPAWQDFPTLDRALVEGEDAYPVLPSVYALAQDKDKGDAGDE